MRLGPSWGKKDKHCDPARPEDQELGSWWDHVLIDPDSKLIVTCVVGRRTADTASAALADFHRRTDGQIELVISSDAYPVYLSAIVSLYGVDKHDLELTEQQKAECGWDELPEVLIPEELCYATVHKHRENNRVVRVEHRLVLGAAKQLQALLGQGSSSPTINTSYVERYHGTHRHQNARKARKVYTFSKELLFHRAATWLCVAAYNFCWQPRTLRRRVQGKPPRYSYRTPAMAAQLTGERWTLQRILTHPLFPPPQPTRGGQRPSKEARKAEGG
jgi:IS1 family transposase